MAKEKYKIHFSEKNVEFKKFISKDPNVLIISSDIKVKYNNFISYNKVFKLKNLLQQINIILSKSNYKIKSNISIGSYLIDTNSRIISREDLSLKLTEREIDLLIYLNNSNLERSSIDLQKNVWRQTGDLETHTVETHIYRLRKKIIDKFQDDSFIISTDKGYIVSK